MSNKDGFDWIPDVVSRINKEEKDDSWQIIALHGMCFIVLCIGVVAISLGWVPHG